MSSFKQTPTTARDSRLQIWLILKLKQKKVTKWWEMKEAWLQFSKPHQLQRDWDMDRKWLELEEAWLHLSTPHQLCRETDAKFKVISSLNQTGLEDDWEMEEAWFHLSESHEILKDWNSELRIILSLNQRGLEMIANGSIMISFKQTWQLHTD